MQSDVQNCLLLILHHLLEHYEGVVVEDLFKMYNAFFLLSVKST